MRNTFSLFMFFILGFILLNFTPIRAQLHHQTIGSQGNTAKSGNIIVSQSIGQKSVIGNINKKGLYVLEGFQQFLFKKKINDFIKTSLTTVIYPNPFESEFRIRIQTPPDKIILKIFTNNGALVSKKYLLINNGEFIATLEALSVGRYIISLEGTNYKFQSHLIKK